MVKGIAFVVGIVCLCLGSLPAMAGGQLSANCSWNCAWAPSSASDQALANNQALLDFQMRSGILNPGASNNYNGTVNQTYTGPSSGSTVTNIDNLNSTSINTTAATGSTVNATATTGQTANGSTQTGTARSTSGTLGSGVFDAGNTVSLGH